MLQAESRHDMASSTRDLSFLAHYILLTLAFVSTHASRRTVAFVFCFASVRLAAKVHYALCRSRMKRSALSGTFFDMEAAASAGRASRMTRGARHALIISRQSAGL